MPEILGYQFDRVFSQPIEKYRQVATIAERDAIPTGKRWRGMLCYVTSDDVDYQLKGGLTNLDWEAASLGNYFELTNNDSDDIIEGTTNLFLDTVDKAKLDFISITQAVDLDALETTVNALGSGLTFKGTWDASSGSFPSGALTGYLYIVSVAGTVDSVSFAVGDSLAAIVDAPSTSTFSANWAKFESVSDVTSVVGLTGAVSKAGLLSALNVEDGATADMTGSEISAAITAHLTSADWQTKLTSEEVLDFVGAAINAGTQTNISVQYDDVNNKINFIATPTIIVYASLATLLSEQVIQVTYRLYEVTDASGFTGITSGRAWVRYKGTTLGTEADYIIISKEESVLSYTTEISNPIDVYHGNRISPVNSINGFINQSTINGATGYYTKNTGTGTGVYAGFEAESGGTLYANGFSLANFGTNYFETYLQNQTGLFAHNNLYFIGGKNTSNIKFRLGNTAISSLEALETDSVLELNADRTVLFPSLTNTLINTGGAQSPITKGYADANYDFSEFLTSTGTRLTGDLITTIGDYDDSGNGVKIVLDQDNTQIDLDAPQVLISQGRLDLTNGSGQTIIQVSPTAGLHVFYFPDAASGTIVVSTTAPATATSTGIAGQIAYDTNYFYVCTATNTWKRIALSTW